jgi:2'-5' RNA ligase
VGVTAATAPQPDNTDGCMIALYPPPDLAKALTVTGGLPSRELHCTVVYAGLAADTDEETLNDVARVLARRPPAEARISGSARFTGGAQDVIVALVDSAALEDLRRDAMGMLAAAGVTVPREHGYTSHLTRAYISPDDPDPAGRLPAAPVTFTTISAVHGGTRTDYPFTTPPAPAEAVRVAYAAGWALSGGPMTARVKAGCAAAIIEAVTRPDDPDALEAATRLGHLEGTHALTAARRTDLLRRHQTAILVAWNPVPRGHLPHP